MSESWEEVTLGEVSEIVTGSTPSSSHSDNWGSGIPFLTPSDISETDYRPSVARRLSTVATERAGSKIVRPGSVAVTCIASIGKIARVCEPTLTNQQMNTLVPNPQRLDDDFAYYMAQGLRGKLNALASGSVTRIIKKSTFSKISVKLPPLQSQREIAEVLGAFDRLIDTNRRLASDVIALSRCWYSSLCKNTTETQLLGDVASVNERSIKPGLAGSSLTYLDISSLDDAGHSVGDEMDWSIAPSRARRGAEVGDTLWSTVRPNRRGHSILLTRPENLVVSTGIAVLKPVKIGPAQLFAATDSNGFVDYLVGRAEGSAYPAVKPDTFRGATIAKLPANLEDEFEVGMKPLWDLMRELVEETRELTRTRDMLLPLLLSGEITPKSAAELLAAA